ncbi:hypothetical protein H5410_011444 [Solanum commersonii]|uniref:Helitron helicase-like domain-containing protein n=1 Tax=Solanum commersonii TaxID=4109 RepID=A0A9J6APY0_SOLCO|nr:hypothetical protein H5410_011444 [Solanum commersonii]
MYTIEFQKRGLPHVHFVIILEEKYKTPEAYDQFVCAALLDPKRNPHLFELVHLHMIHGPCGHDKTSFNLHTDNANIEIDEIKEYQSARWVSPPEATWRIYASPIREMNPCVYHLQLHLDGQQLVSFKSTDNIDKVINNPMIKKLC